jgi:E3 ubiquitin-protein ligase RNF115/126
MNFEDLLAILMENDPNQYGPPPAAKQILKELPRLNCDSFKESNEECSVCMDRLSICVKVDTEEEQPPDKEHETLIIKMPCTHSFHFNCLMKWLKVHNSCPTCRHELPTDDLDYETQK